MDFSLILGLAGVAGQLLISRRPVLGWAIAALNQPLWVVFAFLSGHLGLLVLTPGYLIAAVINLRKARRAQITERDGKLAEKTLG